MRACDRLEKKEIKIILVKADQKVNSSDGRVTVERGTGINLLFARTYKILFALSFFSLFPFCVSVNSPDDLQSNRTY